MSVRRRDSFKPGSQFEETRITATDPAHFLSTRRVRKRAKPTGFMRRVSRAFHDDSKWRALLSPGKVQVLQKTKGRRSLDMAPGPLANLLSEGSAKTATAVQVGESPTKAHPKNPKRNRRGTIVNVLRSASFDSTVEKGHKNEDVVSYRGVLLTGALGAVITHAVRVLVIRAGKEYLIGLLDPSTRKRMKSKFALPPTALSFLRGNKGRTLELYILSLLHSMTWVAFGLYKLIKSKWNDRTGSTRLLAGSAGFYLYTLFSVKSIWTHPNLLFHTWIELTRIVSILRSVGVDWLVPSMTALHMVPETFLTAASTLEFLHEPSGSIVRKVVGALAAASVVFINGIALPVFAAKLLGKHPELHQPSYLPRKLSGLLSFVLQIQWVWSRKSDLRQMLLVSTNKPATALATAAASPTPSYVSAALSQALPSIGQGFVDWVKHQFASNMLFAAYGVAAVIPYSAAKIVTSSNWSTRLLSAGVVAGVVASTQIPLGIKDSFDDFPSWQQKTLIFRAAQLLKFLGLEESVKRVHDFQLVEETPIETWDKSKTYVWGHFPHGLQPFHAQMMGSELLKRGIYPRTIGASVLFKMPGLQHVLAASGAMPADRSQFVEALQKSKHPSNHINVIVGGIAEMFYTDKTREVILISKRKGFVKYALMNGCPLVPCYGFGNTQLFDVLGGVPGDIFKRISRALRVSLIPFVGRSVFSPFTPRAVPITAVIGTPIDVEREERPTQEQINKLHARFCSELRRIFDKYKGMHPGFENKTLYFDNEVENEDGSAVDFEDPGVLEARSAALEEFHLYPSKL